MPVVVSCFKNNVLLRLRPIAEKTGSIIRVSHYEAARRADVLAVGPECRDLTVGLGVLCNPLIGQNVGEDLLQPVSSVLAILEEGD